MDKFARLNSTIIGVSPDSVQSHLDFAEKNNLKVDLLSDPDHKVLEQYGAWQLKKQYGREFWGVARSTFLIDPDGKIAYVWRGVKVDGHAQDVLNKLQEIQGKR